MSVADAERAWLDTGLGYQVALDGATLVCRNTKGKVLSSVPKAVREGETAEELYALRDWLARHAGECRANVETWLLGSFPVPVRVIAAVWADPAWREVLENAVVHADGTTGFLRGADPDRGAGVVNLDGETEWVAVPSVTIPHPVLLDDLDDLREFAGELGIVQGLPQLMREVYAKPADLTGTSITTFSGGHFAQLRYAVSRCQQVGVAVRGAYAVCRTWDGGDPVQARFWIGSGSPDWETQTEDLHWVDANEHVMPLSAIGPVAYSEGMRMAALIYAAAKNEPREEQ